MVALGSMVGVVGTTILRKAFESLGGWTEEYITMQDVELWYRLALAGDTRYTACVFGDYRHPKPRGPNPTYVVELMNWHLQKARDADSRLIAWASRLALRAQVLRLEAALGEEGLRADSEIRAKVSEAHTYLAKHPTAPCNALLVQRALRTWYSLRRPVRTAAAAEPLGAGVR